MNTKQIQQFSRLKSVALSLGAKDDNASDEQLILSMKHLANLNEEEVQLAEDKETIEKMLSKIEELEAKNKAETSRIVGIIMDNDSLKKKLAIAEAEIAQLKSNDFNSLVNKKLKDGIAEDEREEFEKLKSKAQTATKDWKCNWIETLSTL